MWRKSWARQNIFGQNGNGECSKRKLLPEERSVWDDYLDMATPPLTPIAGQVCISTDIGYSSEQLSTILKTPVETIKRANKAMETLQMITIENNGIVVINNWSHYQSEYERQKSYRTQLQEKVTTKGNKVDIDIDKKRYRKREYKDIYIKILNYWNSLGIIHHKYLDDKCLGTLNVKLDNGYSPEELIQAISNYAHILKGKTYFWTYKWTLYEFLKRGLDKFMDLETAKQNYTDKYRQKEEEDGEIRKIRKEMAKQ